MVMIRSETGSRRAWDTERNAWRLGKEGKRRRDRYRNRKQKTGRIAQFCTAAGGSVGFFRSEPSEVCKKERMKFIVIKTENGVITEKIAFYCKALEVSRQGFYEYLKNKDK
ncbi:MAG: hypothetical protein NC177_16345, partial [Ruminococcus flavefaciens]|nr:hypothetical protein [Ruminococcus flavefaciens]